MDTQNCRLRSLLAREGDSTLSASRLLAFTDSGSRLERAIIDVGDQGSCVVVFRELVGSAALNAMTTVVFSKVFHLPLPPHVLPIAPGPTVRTLSQVRAIMGGMLGAPQAREAEPDGAITGLAAMMAAGSVVDTIPDNIAGQRDRAVRLQNAAIEALRDFLGNGAEEAVKNQASRTAPITDPDGFVNGCEAILANVIGPGLARAVLQRVVRRL